MTPATRRPVVGADVPVPVDVVADEAELSWERVHPRGEAPWPGTERLLDAVCLLAQANPAEMAAFMESYGVLDVPGIEFRESFVQTRRPGRVQVRDVRRWARGIAAARRVAAALVVRRPGGREDWAEMFRLEGKIRPDREYLDDWKLGREVYASWITSLLQETGVAVEADWAGRKGLAMEPVAHGLASIVAILLCREVGAEGEYRCDSCGSPVARARAPQPGQGVFCDRPQCKREQRRRNTAAYRARKRGGEA